VDYISQNLDNIQYQLANHPVMLDNSLFYDVFGHEGSHLGQDPLDLLADRAAASPLPSSVGHGPSQGHALVQYGMQESSTSSSSSPRGQPRSRDREDQYGRRDWSQGQQQQQQSEYDVVHHLFNG